MNGPLPWLRQGAHGVLSLPAALVPATAGAWAWKRCQNRGENRNPSRTTEILILSSVPENFDGVGVVARTIGRSPPATLNVQPASKTRVSDRHCYRFTVRGDGALR